ncbi:MAG: transposase [Bacillota bacterium]
MKLRARQLFKYINKVHGIFQSFATISDGRVNPSIPLASILKVLFCAMVLKVHSFNLIESYLREGYFKKFLGSAEFGLSADTLGYALARTILRQFSEINDSVIKKARYGKVYQGGTIDGFKVTALDGSEVFRTKSESWSCEQCRITEITKEDGTKEAQYHEDIVGVCYVGRHPNLVLGLERIARGEGEISAAMRLLKELYRRHNRYTDIITLDSLYAKAPIINEIISQNMIAVIRVKQQDYNIIRDAEGLFAQRKPDFSAALSLNSSWYQDDDTSGRKYYYRVRIWDGSGFESWPKVKVPLRVLRIEETRVSHTHKVLSEPVVTHLVTTADKSTVPTETLWRILHRRWDVENKVFHDLKKFWGFGHNYHHDPTAFMVMLHLAVIAMNLTFLFYHRRLPASFKRQNSLLSLREMIKMTFWSVSKELWDPG